jgi:hypothetical protein
LIGVDDISPDNVADHVLSLTATPLATGHVYTLHAELEGMKLATVFDKLLSGWRAQGYALGTLRDLADSLDVARLPRHIVSDGQIPGRAGTLALQGKEFLV